jgi:hypothetical protein
MQLIIYSKLGCHLCEGLIAKLEQITSLPLELEIRDITTQSEWFDRYQYEIPVMCTLIEGREKIIPRPSPRVSVKQLEKLLGGA